MSADFKHQRVRNSIVENLERKEYRSKQFVNHKFPPLLQIPKQFFPSKLFLIMNVLKFFMLASGKQNLNCTSVIIRHYHIII